MLKFKTRKLQNFNYSFLISVPKIWVDSHGLGKGSKIAITLDEEKNLVLKPEEDEK